MSNIDLYKTLEDSIAMCLTTDFEYTDDGIEGIRVANIGLVDLNEMDINEVMDAVTLGIALTLKIGGTRKL